MDDVDPPPLEHARDEPLQTHRERDATDAAVDRQRDRLADLDDVLGRWVVAPGGGDDPHVVPELGEVAVRLADVRVRAARARIRVRAHDANFHWPCSSRLVSARFAASPRRLACGLACGLTRRGKAPPRSLTSSSLSFVSAPA